MNATKTMAKKHGTKAAFLTSLLSLILCFTMLVGTTLAWFTDTVTSGENQIIAGNLDVEVYYAKESDVINNDIADSAWTQMSSETKSLFSVDLWEPGHTEVVYLKIVNKGTLAFNYTFNVSPISENPGTNVYNETFKLSDYLVFGTSAPAASPVTYKDRAAARTAAGTTQKLNQTDLQKTGVLYAANDTTNPNSSEAYTALVVYMPEEVGNEANYLTGTEPPQIKLGVTVYATQKDHEKDSFGNDYDGGAVNSDEYTAGTATQYVETKQQTLSATVDSTQDTSFTSNVTPGLESDKQTTVTFPKNISELENNAEVDLEVAASPVVLANNSFTVGSDGAVAALTLNVTVDGTPVTQFENVSGEAQYVTVSTYVAKNMTNVSLSYGSSETWTQVATEEAVTAGKFYYDSATGKLVYTTNHFSTFIIGAAEKAYVAENNTAYLKLEDAISAADDGAYNIYLLKDVDLTSYKQDETTLDAECVFDLTNDTLDLNGYTITSKNHAVDYTGDNVIIMNGTFEVAENGSYGLCFTEATATLNDVSTIGGINAHTSTIEIYNGSCYETKGTNYYALWADFYANIIVYSGNFSSPSTCGGCVLNAIANNESSSITIKGGNFTALGTAEMFNSSANIIVEGGTFNKTVPNSNCTYPYAATDNGNGTWTVSCVASYKVTYTVEEYASIANKTNLDAAIEANSNNVYLDPHGVNASLTSEKIPYNSPDIACYNCTPEEVYQAYGGMWTAGACSNMWFTKASVTHVEYFDEETAANTCASSYSGATVTKIN